MVFHSHGPVTPPDEAEQDEPLLFQARITPFRSATVRALRNISIALTAASAATALLCILAGAWVVAVFSGIVCIAAIAAICGQARVDRCCEVIELRAHSLLLHKTDRGGTRTTARFNPHMIEVRHHVMSDGSSDVAVHHFSGAVKIATFLHEKEKYELKCRLHEAISKLRREEL
ncbi:MAG: DUF2244 domain-containing protein [Rhodospirillales bacterium]|nr:DUF2244 domain-containing protein [Rhodospirillales bacterium]